MRRGRLILLAVTCLTAGTGCGGTAGPATSPDAPARQGVGPHGGVAVALGERAFGEVVIEPGSAGPVLAVYLLESNQSTAFAGKPTSVVIECDAGSGPVSVSLLPKAGKAAGNRFEAKLPNGLDDRFSGKLSVVVDGQTLDAELSPF